MNDATNVPAGTSYVCVHGQNAYGLSGESNNVVVVVRGECDEAPDPPTGLNASVVGKTMNLSWVASSGCPPDSSILSAGSGPGPGDTLPGDVGSVTSLMTTAPPGIYHVRVFGRNACGVSGPSNENAVTVP